MADFFNPNGGFDANTPQNYDHNTQAQKLAMMQALAKQMGQGIGDGKMVGGWYAAPSKGSYIANALQQALGGYMQVKGLEGQSDLDKADRNALVAARKAYGDASDPSNYIDKTLEAVPTPEAQYMYKYPENVGPPAPNVQTEVPLADRRTTYPNETTQFPMSLPPNATAFSKMMASGNQDPNNSPAPWAPDGGTQVQQVGVTGKREDTFDVNRPAPEDEAAARAGQVRFLSKAMAADRQNALDLMSRTKAGGPLANAIMARDYSPAEWDFQKIKDGETESLIAVNKRDPTQMRKVYGADANGLPSIAERRLQFEQAKDARDSAAQLKRDERDYGFKVDEAKNKYGEKATDNSRADDKLLLDINQQRAKTKEELASTQSGIGTLEKGMQLITKWNARGGPLSKARLATGLAVGENEAVELDNTLKAITALNIKSIFGAAPSDKEQAAFAKVVGDAAAGKTAALSGLDNLYQRAKATEAAHQENLSRYDEQANRYTPKPAGTKPGGYGQSVGGPADILNSRFN
ncbi:hypothetical protein LE191_04230 [Janthinobacterium sp. HSC-3S05]|uniref:hypothetical protein n=1 Tax=Janthinobacterium lividum TaxID=29581 RepID=UPI001CD84841|nr:hypothetical protein [Janthinobacterium lividum]MCA1859317.1 hypothetical protein [Janthinobacterium lividum]